MAGLSRVDFPAAPKSEIAWARMSASVALTELLWALLWTGGPASLLRTGPNQQGWAVRPSVLASLRATMPDPIDLFGPGGDNQLSLFGVDEGRMAPPVRSYTPDPEDVRRRLHALLSVARDARSMPWAERDARMWQVVFPQMANWLPDDEANQLRIEFAQEMERLKAA